MAKKCDRTLVYYCLEVSAIADKTIHLLNTKQHSFDKNYSLMMWNSRITNFKGNLAALSASITIKMTFTHSTQML